MTVCTTSNGTNAFWYPNQWYQWLMVPNASVPEIHGTKCNGTEDLLYQMSLVPFYIVAGTIQKFLKYLLLWYHY